MDTTHFTIITHNGLFHMDEVTSYAMLDYLFPYNTLIRTRDMSIITDDSIVIDVGEVYNPTLNKFDHHQKSFNETFYSKSIIPMSSTGLIYKHYGMQILKKFCSENHFNIDKEQYKKAFNYFYDNFCSEIDAFDNGIRQYSDNFYDALDSGIIIRKYYTSLSLGQLIAKQNYVDISDDKQQLKAFKRASSLVWNMFVGVMTHYFSTLIKNIDDCKIFDNAMKERFSYDKSGFITVIKVECDSWKQCLREYEHKNPGEPKINFIVYPNASHTWNIRTISDQQFKTRKDLLSFEELKKLVSKPYEVIFVHTKLFVGGAETIETCVEMGKASL